MLKFPAGTDDEGHRAPHCLLYCGCKESLLFLFPVLPVLMETGSLHSALPTGVLWHVNTVFGTIRTTMNAKFLSRILVSTSIFTSSYSPLTVGWDRWAQLVGPFFLSHLVCLLAIWKRKWTRWAIGFTSIGGNILTIWLMGLNFLYTHVLIFSSGLQKKSREGWMMIGTSTQPGIEESSTHSRHPIKVWTGAWEPQK